MQANKKLLTKKTTMKNTFFNYKDAQTFERRIDKLRYFFQYFKQVKEDMIEAKMDATADDYQAAMDLVIELNTLISKEDKTAKY